MSYRPALRTFDARVQHVTTILAFEALGMKVSVQSSDSWCFGLTFFGDNWFLADRALVSKQLGVVLGTVDAVLVVSCERHPHQTLVTSLAFEAFWVKTSSSDLDMFTLNTVVTRCTSVLHVIDVVFLTVDLVIELVVLPHDGLLADTTDSSVNLEISLADGFVLKEKVGVAQGLVANMTLHAARMIVAIIVDDTVPGYLLFAHTTLLLR